MKKIVVNAEVFVGTERPKTFYNIVKDLLEKSQDGYTNLEIFQKTGIDQRRIREVIQTLRVHDGLKEKNCRCGRTPIYYL